MEKMLTKALGFSPSIVDSNYSIEKLPFHYNNPNIDLFLVEPLHLFVRLEYFDVQDESLISQHYAFIHSLEVLSDPVGVYQENIDDKIAVLTVWKDDFYTGIENTEFIDYQDNLRNRFNNRSTSSSLYTLHQVRIGVEQFLRDNTSDALTCYKNSLEAAWESFSPEEQKVKKVSSLYDKAHELLNDLKNNSKYQQQSFILYKSLDNAIFHHTNGRIANICQVYQGPAIFDLAYIRSLIAPNDDMETFLLNYKISSKSINLTKNQELFEDATKYSKLFHLLSNLQKLVHD